MLPLKLTGKLLGSALTILESAQTQRADAALRETLRRKDLLPEEKAFVSRAVFSYYRWQGWLDQDRAHSASLRRALEIADHFAREPAAFRDHELLDRAVPEWLRQHMNVTAALVREWQAEPRLWLRTRGGNGEELAGILGDAEVHPAVPGAVWYKGSDDLFLSFEFKRGEFEIQDLSSQIVSLICGPKPGETWWDACAGEGGKTLHLADLMQNKGLIWASDPAQWRLDHLKRRASRAQVFNYRLKAWSNTDHLPTKTKFDGVLIDAPCSGIGTWGRNPHARWTTTPRDVQELAQVQQNILAKAAHALKPGGKLVYSVCTLATAETHSVAEHFDSTQPGFTRMELPNPLQPDTRAFRVTLLPQDLHANGMFIAAWIKS